LRSHFVDWCCQRGYRDAAATAVCGAVFGIPKRDITDLERDWDRMVAFYCRLRCRLRHPEAGHHRRFPREHWTHIRTTNPVESPFAALRLRTDAAKRFKRVENATAVIWKMLLVAETRFRRLNAPEFMKKVYLGAEYQDGIESTREEAAA